MTLPIEIDRPRPGLFTRRSLIAGAGICLSATFVAHAREENRAEAKADGFRVLRARPGQAALRGDKEPPTAVWGFGGSVPGPLLRVRRGEEVRARLINDLPEPTAIHWHGVRVPNSMDGAPPLTQPLVEPGQSFDYRFVARDAGTFWYRRAPGSGEQRHRGLYGALIVDEPERVDVDRDVLLVLDDWRLTPDGAIDTEGFRAAGDAPQAPPTAAHFTVNSLPRLNIPVRTNERVRLRLLNACNAKILGVGIEGHQPVVMAIDGQPAEPFAARDGRVALGPGNRVDLFVDTTLEAGTASAVLLATGSAVVPIARLVYETGPPARPVPRPEPAPLPANPLPARMDFGRALRLDVPLEAAATTAWRSAAQATAGPPGAPLFTAARGRTVMLAFANKASTPQSIHPHGHHCRLLDNLDDGWKPFWLDTVLVMPGQTARIAFVADNPGKWALENQVMDARETALSTWFEVRPT